MQILVDDDTWVLVLTGAGISAESGIATFRGSDGLWEGHRIEDVASPGGFRRDPALVWTFYSARRAAAATARPNPGHLALVDLERRLGDRFLLATQNVDGLHTLAGSERVVELHGCLWRTKCSRCDRPPFEDRDTYDAQHLPGCSRCDARGEFALLRPHIVWFGELLDPADLGRVDAFMRAASRHRFVFLAVGTSGVVYPAAGMVDAAARLGAETWLVNLEPPDNASQFEHQVEGKAGEVLPGLWG